MKRQASWLQAGAALLCLVVILSSCATTSAPVQAGPAITVGAPLPELSLLDPSSGQPLSLKSLSGQVVLLDIWASWCQPCKEELPLLDELAGRLAGAGVAIIAVSVDEDKAAMNEFLSLKKSWRLRLLHDPQHQVPSMLRPDKMPSSYLIDRHGVLRAIYGGFNRNDVAQIESSIKELSRP